MRNPGSRRAHRHIVVLLLTLLSPWALQADRSDTLEAQSLDEPGVGSGEVKAFSCDCVLPKEKRIALGQAKGANVTPPSAIGEKRILLYRVDFSDFVGAAILSNAAVTLITNLNNYYRDMSYGLMGYAPVGSGSVVTDTLRLPEPSSAYDNNFTKLIEATRQVATNAGYAAAGYDFDVVCTGTKPFLVFGAVAYVGGPGVWVGNNNFNVGVLGHELGHNLGLPHASFWFTSDQSVIGPGVKQEYGDPFDSMGAPGGNTSHFNARFKSFLEGCGPLAAVEGPKYRCRHDYSLQTGYDPAGFLCVGRIERRRVEDHYTIAPDWNLRFGEHRAHALVQV